MRPISVLLLVCAALAQPARAQDQAVQRALIMRQQQSDAFSLQLRQSQQQLSLPTRDLQRKLDIETSQLRQREDLDSLGTRQLREVGQDTPDALRPYERSRLEAERRALLNPQ